MNALAPTRELPAATAAWAFNETQLQHALAHLGNNETAEIVMEFLTSAHARKLRINDGRHSAGLVPPRHRRVVDGASVTLGGCMFQSPCLARYQGASVLATFEPDDAETVSVFSLSGEFITTAHRVRLGGAG